MLNLGTEEVTTKPCNEEVIKQRLTEHTCKTNLNPQFMIKQSYTGFTNKTFVGNWTEYGFWISKYKLQMWQFRPDIIARFYLKKRASSLQVKIKYSLGFSSIFWGSILILIFSAILSSALMKNNLFSAISIFSAIYVIATIIQYRIMKKAVNDKILKGISPRYYDS